MTRGVTVYGDDHPRREWGIRRVLVALGVILLLGWVAVPLVRAVMLLETNPFRSAGSPPRIGGVLAVRFRATDGTRLRGWLLAACPSSPVIVLVPGFKADGASMVPYARMLRSAGYNALAYDSRGTGGSGGLFSAGLYEVRDVEGAVRFLQTSSRSTRRAYGLLGVSLGSGDAIMAAQRLRTVRAVVADSPYADQHVLIDRLGRLQLGRVSIPTLPLGGWLVDHVLGGSLAAFRPIVAAHHLGSRGLLLIHARDDGNPTTPLSDARRLRRAAGRSATLWIAPHGGHAGALAAQPAAYRNHVVAFFRRYLPGPRRSCPRAVG